MVRSTVRSLLGEPRPARALRRRWHDWALAAAPLVSAAVETPLREDFTWGPLTAILLGVLAVALLFRRTQPLAVVVAMFGCIAAVAVTNLLGVDTSAAEPYAIMWVLVLPYALLRWGSGMECAVGLGVLLVVGALGTASDAPPPGEAAAGMVVLLFPAALAASIRYRATARRREIDQTKLLEREQLARELHDTVAHHVSAIAVQAQAGRAVAASAPEQAVQVLAVIEEAASQALAEMRAMVGLLRAGDEVSFAPQPGVRDIPRLAEANGDWPRIEVALTGDLDGLPLTVDAAVYRLAQESITNAVRHARHASRVEVHVRGDGDAVRLDVRDNGDAGPAERDAWTGYGLIGMQERAHLLGGTFEAGPADGGGWTVRAVLPRARAGA